MEGDTPINWIKFSRSLFFNMDNSEACGSSTWSMSTEQNFPCELCISSRKQGGFLDWRVSDSVRWYILSSTTSTGCPTETWLQDSLCFKMRFMICTLALCTAIYVAIFTNTFFVQEHGLSCGPSSGWESISDFFFQI